MAAVELKGLTQLRARFQAIQPNAAMMRSLALHAVRNQKQMAPRKTGNLSRSIMVGVVTDKYAETKATANYAAATEGGSGLHGPKGKKYPIFPKNKKALHFASGKVISDRFGSVAQGTFRKSGSLSSKGLKRYGGGAFVTVRKVMHPGVKPQPFMVPGAKKAIADVGAEGIVKAWNEAA